VEVSKRVFAIRVKEIVKAIDDENLVALRCGMPGNRKEVLQDRLLRSKNPADFMADSCRSPRSYHWDTRDNTRIQWEVPAPDDDKWAEIIVLE
jgi:hypothetical protein